MKQTEVAAAIIRKEDKMIYKRKMSIKRFLLIVFALLMTSRIQAQNILEGVVRDEESGEVLPFAHIYCQDRLATMSNSQGEFALVAKPSDVIRVTFLGHKSISVVARELPKVVMLKTSVQYLPEVVVLPASNLIKDVTRKTANALKKWRDERSIFFFRQSTFVDDTQRNMMEAFFDARCALTVSNFKLFTGRIAEGGDVFYAADLYKLSQIWLLKKDKNKPSYIKTIVPLDLHFDDYYETSLRKMEYDGQALYEIHFSSNNKAPFEKIVTGTLYVDAEQLLPVKMQGKIKNLTIVHYSVEGSLFGEELPLNISFDVSFSIERNFPEVMSVIINSKYKDKNHDYRFLSLLYNMGCKNLDTQMKSYYITDLRKQIKKRGFNKDFWNRHETLKRTDLEKTLNDLQAEEN